MEDTLKYAYAQGKVRLGRDAGKRLRLLRKKFNMSRKEMASRFRVSANYLSELETGKKIPTGPLLVAIESVLMLDRRRLLTGKEEMPLKSAAAFNKINNESIAVVELLRGYKTLSLEGKRKLLMALEMLSLAERKTHSA